ncbi:MAG TPA: winged helix-turn-helix domain-containing protein [Nitrososphaeraceae archaeon]|nr:winged helix-turn-helix domain-containing protein [Nitrososphaeraceae archaeon]
MTSKYIHRYRNRIDIIAQLLDAASSPTTKTRMMYKAMLSYEQLKEYLLMLTENDLIGYDKPSQRFTATDKGFQFLNTYEDLSKLIRAIAAK